MQMNHLRKFCLPLAAAAVLAVCPAVAESNETATAIQELQKQIHQLQEEVSRLKAVTQSPTTNMAAMPAVTSESSEAPAVDHSLLGEGFYKSKGLTIGFYGESKYRMPEAGADSFDAHRYVLTPGYEIADWLIFNSELELEHGGVDESTARGSRFNGELEIEQFYVDILINDYFNVRSLGIDLVPVGRVNTTHEPTTFYSTERPELYREIIPSTWMEPSIGLFGKVTDTLDWRVMVSTGLEDYSSSSPGVPGVTATGGMRNARPRMRAADENKLAYTGRLHFNGIKGLDASTSAYHVAAEGFNQQDVNMTLWDIEALYRLPGTGLELRGDFAYWFIDSPENLLANNNVSLTDDIGETMYGWYVEAAYHLWPNAWRQGRGANMDFVPFVRFSQIVTQDGLPAGSTELTDGTANRDFLTFGASWFLNQHFVVKGDYRMNLDGTATSAASATSQDYFQMGVGMFF
jgi:outer membrane murein-binding lipoprotein Lpp